ncbi:MAG: diguanylate cyclase [Ignavibacteria bacterium]
MNHVADDTRRDAGANVPRWPVHSLLLSLVLACLIPGLIGAGLLVFRDYQSSRSIIEENALRTTRALVQAVDSHLFKAQAVAQALSTSDALRLRDFAGLYRQARAFLLLNHLGNSIALSDASGQQLFNTSREFGEPLPRHGSLDQIRQVVETGQPSISRVFMGNLAQRLLVTVDVPVILEGKVIYVLTTVIRPDILNDILKSQGLPQDWIAAVLDSEGTFVTRTRSPEEFVGKKPSAELLRHAGESLEGAFESITPDGLPVLSIFTRSPATGWTVALGIPRAAVTAAYREPLILLAVGMIVLFAAGLWLAWSLGERIAVSVRSLAAQAKALGLGQQVLVPEVHIKEAGEVAVALADASRLLRERTEALETERASRERQLEKLVAERTEALEAAIQESERLARRDALTGLQNRLSANERLRAEFLRLKRTGRAYAVLLLDIDHFKRINDSYGHEAGDQVLRQVARVLAAGTRETDFAGRFGGEEFLLLLPETDPEGALAAAEKIRAAVAEAEEATARGVTVSIGVAGAALEDGNEDDAVRRADRALYDAKARGRNRVEQAGAPSRPADR